MEHRPVLAALTAGGEEFAVRRARREDVPALVALLADDPLGRSRETAPGKAYLGAFDAVDASDEQLLVCLTTGHGDVVGTLQLSFIRGLSRGGALRGQIEAVRVHRDHRNNGLGRVFVEWAIEGVDGADVRSCSSRPTVPAATPTGSTSVSGSCTRTRVSN